MEDKIDIAADVVVICGAIVLDTFPFVTPLFKDEFTLLYVVFAHGVVVVVVVVDDEEVHVVDEDCDEEVMNP